MNGFSETKTLPALPSNAHIAIISPAGPSSPEAMQAGVAYLESLGHQVSVMPNALEQRYYLAGSVEQRLSDFHQAFADTTVDMVLCARGGYGAMQLLPHIDWDLMKANPKWFVGFSDITVLLLSIAAKAGFSTVHGPMLTSNLIEGDTFSQQQLWQLLHGNIGPSAPVVALGELSHYQCLHPGPMVQGPLVGGNLSLLSALCGTPYQPNFDGCIVLIEDWHESFYSIDRQWQQMYQSGLLSNAKAIIWGDFVELSEPENQWPDYPLKGLFSELTAALNIPVGMGYPVGHGQQSASLLLGAEHCFEATSGHLAIAPLL